MNWRSMGEIELRGKRVLIREDLNAPIAAGSVSDDTRLRRALPTLEQAMAAGGRVIVMSHLGRPEEGAFDAAASLAPVAIRLGELLGREVPLIGEWRAEIAVGEGEAVLLENVRFNAGEEANDDDLARRLAGLCDVFVMDAFATAHRAQASTHGVARFAPIACAGPLLAAELEALGKALERPARPMVAIVGGAKVSSKMGVLENLCARVDRLIVGGGIANTFIAAAGYPIGRSLHEPGRIGAARELMRVAEANGGNILIPTDVVVAPALDAPAKALTRPLEQVGGDELIVDIGPRTIERYAAALRGAGTIVWNGPVGVFEVEAFAAGTRAVAEAVAASEAFSIGGGGDTLAAIARFGVTGDISYISTGGGAFLEFLEGRPLPGVTVLSRS